jgi:hypothetical protein
MQTVIKLVYLVALVVWVGQVITFSFLVAPALFAALPTASAGDAVGAIFPWYYGVSYVCGIILLGICGVLHRHAGRERWWKINAALFALMLLATCYAGLVVYPRTVELRPQIRAENAPDEARREFGRLHAIAVGLNGVVFVCGLGAVLVTAGRLRW